MDGDGLIPSDRTQTTNNFHAVLDDSGLVVILDTAKFVCYTFWCLRCPPFPFREWKVHLAYFFAGALFAIVDESTSFGATLEIFRAATLLHPLRGPV